MVLIQNNVSLLDCLKDLDRALIGLPRRLITTVSGPTYDRLEFIFNHCIDVHSTKYEDIVTIMEKNKLSKDTKQLIISKWISILHRLDSDEAWNNKQNMINKHVLNIT